MPRRESAATCAALMEDGYVYLDVRTVQEFEAGHPKGAYNIPAFLIGPGGRSFNENFVAEVKAQFATDASIVIGCRSGARSLAALQILEGEGYTDIVDNEPGMVGPGGWEVSGLPMATAAEAGRDYASLKR